MFEQTEKNECTTQDTGVTVQEEDSGSDFELPPVDFARPRQL